MRGALILLGTIGLVGSIGGQQPGKVNPNSTPAGNTQKRADAQRREGKRSLLEEVIDQAMANNPDLRVASAKAREAEAMVNQVQLQMVQKVVAAYQVVEDAKAALKSKEYKWSSLKQRYAAGQTLGVELQEAERELAQAKAKLATAQAEMDYLIGKSPPHHQARRNFYLESRYLLAERDREVLGLDKQRQIGIQQPAAQRIREVLERKVTLQYKETPIREVLKEVRELMQGVHLQVSPKVTSLEEKVTAKLTNVPLAAVLQLLEDILGDGQVVIREYGVFLAPSSQIPPGAMRLADLWRQDTAGAAAEKKK